MIRADILAAEIGSTITKLSAFSGPLPGKLEFLCQSTALTTVKQGDVSLGLAEARKRLDAEYGIDTTDAELIASASAAGGLRMSVHGLTRDMTLRAAREASLGAGANLVCSTAGLISPEQVKEIKASSPNLVLLAGGVDFGDKETVTQNAHVLASAGLNVPVIYAGNRSAASLVAGLFERQGIPIRIVDNVYPRIDELNIQPVREVIHDVFSRHIVTAPGMERIREMVSGEIIPTPGAVLRASELLYRELEDLLTVDVGGATTDIHSVTEGGGDNSRMRMAPEPLSKRTVEGDLGIYYNVEKIIEASGGALGDSYAPEAIPIDGEQRKKALQLSQWAVNLALWRHAGEIRSTYGSYRWNEVILGRDLTAVKAIVGTGGALTRLDGGMDILCSLWPDPKKKRLLPGTRARVFLDSHYIMAAAGLLAKSYPDRALDILRKSLGYSRNSAGRGEH
ncbi:MAG: DNA mismatch repair protein MutL [Spirochaeta sp.]|nr:DNA mismatch repair protein MutL [Spirochaeta sp.]